MYKVFKYQGQQQKAQFRVFEVLFEKITNLKSHLIFNEMYIYIYIFTCTYIYIYILALNLSLLQNERENEER